MRSWSGKDARACVFYRETEGRTELTANCRTEGRTVFAIATCSCCNIQFVVLFVRSTPLWRNRLPFSVAPEYTVDVNNPMGVLIDASWAQRGDAYAHACTRDGGVVQLHFYSSHVTFSVHGQHLCGNRRSPFKYLYSHNAMVSISIGSTSAPAR